MQDRAVHVDTLPLSRGRDRAGRLADLAALLVAGDLAAAAASALAAPVIWAAIDPGFVPTPTLPLWQAGFVVTWVVLLRLFKGAHVDLGLGRRSAVAVGQALVAAALLVLASFFLFPFLAPRGSSLLSLPLAAAATLGWRFAYLRMAADRELRRVVAVVGTDEAARAAARAMVERAPMTYRLAAFIDGGAVGPVMADVPFRHVEDDLWKNVEPLGVDLLVIGHTRALAPVLLADLARCFEHGIEAIPATSVYEQLTGRVLASALEADWYAELPTVTRGVYMPLKRAIDIALSFVLGALLLLPMLLIAAAILLEDGRPVLHRQVRVGQRGDRFVLHKFRSMLRGAEADGPVWAEKDDARVTRIGGLLRRTHVDELPQLWDILRGKMSLIGPRPERPEFVDRLSAELPLYRARALVRPGITGWAQVQYPYAGSVVENLAKLEYDLYYVRHLGPAVDFGIALRTVRTMFTLGGR